MSKDVYVAIDFDGTCVEHKYPKIGNDIGATRWLKEAHRIGASLILYTMRSGKELDEAMHWAIDHQVEFLAANYNPTQSTWSASPKIYAHIYVDDAALGVPLVIQESGARPYVDWSVAGPMLLRAIEAKLS